MNCQHYSDILNVFLDGEIDHIPGAAKKHAETCQTCQALTQELLGLHKFAGRLEAAQLTPEGENAITARVATRIAASKKSRRFSPGGAVTDFLAALRWRPVLATVVAGVLLIVALQQFRGDEAAQKPVLQAEDEIEVILEEHALQMESGIFQTDAVPTRVVATVASSRK
jgi:hypothetical protein